MARNTYRMNWLVKYYFHDWYRFLKRFRWSLFGIELRWTAPSIKFVVYLLAVSIIFILSNDRWNTKHNAIVTKKITMSHNDIFSWMAHSHMAYSWQIGLLMIAAVLVIGFIVSLFYIFCTRKSKNLESDCNPCNDDSYLPRPKGNLLAYYYSIWYVWIGKAYFNKEIRWLPGSAFNPINKHLIYLSS